MNKNILPLTDVQRAYLYGRNENLFLGGVSTHFYTEHCTTLDREKLEISVNRVIEEQPSMRSYITSDAKQCFLDEVPYYHIEEEDISDLGPEEQKKKILEIRNTISARVFELDKWPMFEFKMYKLNSDEKLLIIDSDMMIMDGMSTEILIEGMHRYYYEPDDVDVVSLDVFRQHIDYIESEREKKGEADRKFWEEIIPKMPSGPQFSKIQSVKSSRFASCENAISKEKWDAVKARLSERQILPSVYVMAAYAKTLARWCGQQQLTLNITVSNRKGGKGEILRAIGDFTEVLLVDFDFSQTSDCLEIAAVTQKKISRYKRHRTFDSSAIIREYSKINKLENQFPFPVVCTSMMFDRAGSKWEWLGERRYQISQTPQVALDNQVSLKAGSLWIHWDYLEECFESSVICDMQKAYMAELLGEQDELQKEYDDNAMVYNSSFIDIEKADPVKLFKQSVEKFGSKRAVEDDDGCVSYEELDLLSDRIASYTVSVYGSGKPVVVKMSRCINAVAAMLGILKSGGYYIPVAEDIPEQRLSFIMDQSGSAAVYDDECVKTMLLNQKSANPTNFATPEKTAYVIYTSGSTGNPKGVVIKHDAVSNTIQDINTRFGITEKDSVIGISAFGFDLSVFDIFGTLASGGTVYLAKSAQDIYGIRKTVAEKNITIWNTVPSIMGRLVENLPDDHVNESLRVVMLSGDWIPTGLPEKIKRHFPNAQIYSLGGATEASIWSIYYPINKISPDWTSIPYGYPLGNQSIWIVDEDGRICPSGVVGEIAIGGRGVASGYLNDKEKTEKQFRNHAKLGNIYMTGDMGCLSKEGYVVFMGRKDFQVKLNGYRIELGEIENCLCRCNNVAEAVADVKKVSGNNKLFAYVTPKKSTGSDSKVLHDAITDVKKNPQKLLEIDEKTFNEIQNCIDEYSLKIMFELFQSLTIEKSFSIDGLISCGKIDSSYRKIVTQWADSLVENEYLVKAANEVYSFTDKKLAVKKIEENIDMQSWKTIFDFLSECSAKLGKIVSGSVNPMSLLFKDGKSDIADSLYGSNPVAKYYNRIVAAFAKAYTEKTGKKIKILEVGAGVGATTEPVIKNLSGFEVDYLFTDVSEFFNDIAKEKFRNLSGIDYGRLDINEVPQTQGFQAGQFDMIIAANVIHDVKDVHNSLSNLRSLLNGNGVLVLLEVTKNRHFHKISMGLMNGYSAYEDELRIKKNAPLLNADEWADALSNAGFSDICNLTSEAEFNGGQSVFVAFAGKDRVYPNSEEMTNMLNENLVKYMIPEKVIIMDSIPHTANGKVDKKALPVCEAGVEDIVEEFVPATTETEKVIADILSEIIGIDKISVTTDFVRMGIDSLKGITFITKLQENDIKINLSELYKYSNIRILGEFVDESKKNEELLEVGEI